MKNRKVVLAARPDGQLKESDMRVVEEEVAELGDGMVLLQIEHLSIDAFIRTTFDEAAFHGTAELGNAVIALGMSFDESLEASPHCIPGSKSEEMSLN